MYLSVMYGLVKIRHCGLKRNHPAFIFCNFSMKQSDKQSIFAVNEYLNQSVYQWFHFNQSVYQCIVWIEIKPIINHILGRKQKADWSKIRSCLLFWIMNLAWYIMIRHIRHTWAEFCSNVMTGRLHHDAGEGWGYTLPLLWIILSIKHVWYLGNIGHVSHHGIRLIYIV